MIFNSFSFLIFFPIVTVLYFVLPHRYRWILLLTASCIFYMAFVPAYILILFVLIGIDYVAGIIIEESEGRKRKLYLILSLVSNVGMLSFFKYFNFVNENLAALYHTLSLSYPVHDLGILLPIGLSFHTFQSMSYTIEVFRGRQKAERHLGIYALYVMFYPQLVAGPIERPGHMLHQFREKHSFDYDRVTDGLKLMLWGFFKKLVIADRLAILTNQVFNHPTDYTGWPLIIALYAFAIQAFCDFSGYSDIAIGAAQVMGFKLMVNFRQPFLSQSIGEFWSRWHISLTSWFRDYIYIPLGGNRVPKLRWVFNIMIVFIISGLWHGAAWTYILFGAIHGALIVANDMFQNVQKRLGKPFHWTVPPTLSKLAGIFFTFNMFVYSLIFFRSNTISDAFYYLTHLFTDLRQKPNLNLGLTSIDMVILLLAILFLETVEILQHRTSARQFVAQRRPWIRWGLYFAGVLSLILFGEYATQQFIYFQF
ncbi:MAG: MBOAT family protein [Chloroflexi bacterium]|nr:MBOAT family protein [Chloroflexota bacterium]